MQELGVMPVALIVYHPQKQRALELIIRPLIVCYEETGKDWDLGESTSECLVCRENMLKRIVMANYTCIPPRLEYDQI